MRVLHVHSGNIYGGVETILVTLARCADLSPQMESHFALCFDGRLSTELTASGAPVYFLGKTRIRQPLSVMRARRVLTELLKTKEFDLGVCHSGWSQTIFGPSFNASARPLVSWFHHPADRRNWLDRWGSRTRPDLAICNSQFTASAASQLYTDLRTEVVYCPVAPPKPYSIDDRKRIRAELKTPESATVIIQVSRMEAWKGQAQHLEALSRIKEIPGWICWQVGGAQKPDEIHYLDELKELANRFGIFDRVKFIGQREDTAQLLSAADIYCQPNLGPEPFGVSFIEALHAGLPVISTNIGGVVEIIDKSCGMLVPSGDALAIANALRALIDSPARRQQMGSAGPLRARTLTEPSRQMRQLESCFQKALNEHCKATGANPVAA